MRGLKFQKISSIKYSNIFLFFIEILILKLLYLDTYLVGITIQIVIN